jgi:hypothetical protein
VTVHMKAVDVSPIKNVVDDRPVGVVYDSPVVINKCYVDCHRQSQYLKWTVIDNVLLQPDSHRQPQSDCHRLCPALRPEVTPKSVITPSSRISLRPSAS